MITLQYAGILGLIMALLSIAVPMQRGKHNVALGDEGVPSLNLAIRRFGNFIEYVPIILLFMYMLENKGASASTLHGLGTALVISRCIHPIVLFSSMEAPNWKKALRFLSAISTWLVLVVCSVLLLI